MRIIKFRSWNHRDKTMDIPDNIANDIDGDKYQIMQYTGLKDKNSNEIYEGDIVHLDEYYGSGLNYEVIYDSGSWLLVENKGVGMEDDDFLAHYREGEIKVIGNIYENPELLT